ncbi:conserved hypothetical protein [Shewanella denitrificans OS217]|uniref:DUF4393 domain-containing protein n=1 Tax=Shewanella denitrificans (strain OS217 / ATCC BAA-1090 / DSM 15013) TaxID=318161 RepID=Q12J20_SHEDO|nr:DUF4393 domain-containing protein [Shewanella denitrificans]ABE56556.1 conserved hypothetical protein [Shewanella denitrificans OS217]
MNEDIEKGLVNNLAVPVYEDVLRPFGKEISKGLASVARSVNTGLYLMEDCVNATVSVIRMTGEKLALLPPEEITFSNPRVALQALDQAKFLVNEIQIQELFSQLIASSLNENKKSFIHPAFIEIIKQLQSDEALILKYMARQDSHRSGSGPTIDISIKSGDENFSSESIIPEFNLIAEDAGCIYPEKCSSYFENLKRIGLIAHHSGTPYSQDQHLRIFESEKAKAVYESEKYPVGSAATWKFGCYYFTGFGREFAQACIST